MRALLSPTRIASADIEADLVLLKVRGKEFSAAIRIFTVFP